MNKEVKIEDLTDLQLASFINRANAEIHQAKDMVEKKFQVVVMLDQELKRREAIAEYKEPVKEPKETDGNK